MPRLPLHAAALALLALAPAALGPVAQAQTLARPGWAGSGMRSQQWWRRAIFFELQPGAPAASGTTAGTPATSTTAATVTPSAIQTLSALLNRLDDLQTLGADAILLRGLDTPARTPPDTAAGTSSPIPAALGTMDDFDRLVRDASSRQIRIVVEVRASQSPEALAATARFWLSRGVAGLYLSGSPAASEDASTQIRQLRALLHTFVGERVLIADDPASAEPTASSRPAAPDLSLLHLRGINSSTPDLSALRASLDQVQRSASASAPAPLVELASDAPVPSDDAARAQATVLLSLSTALAIGPGQLPPPPAPPQKPTAATSDPAPSPLDWYRRIFALHRGNPTIRSGSMTLLNHDAEGALVSVWRPRTPGSQTVVAITNLSPNPLHLSLTQEFAALHLRGSFLRTLLRSDSGMGAMPLRAVTLPPFGVYIGELGR